MYIHEAVREAMKIKGCFEKLFIHDLRDAQITHLSD